LRELAARQHTTREEERKHIARELHDDLGQFLTALRMSVSLLRVRFGQDNPALTAHAKGMTELVDRNIQVVRNVAASLRPVALDMGIQPALEWLVDDFASHAGIAATLLVEDDTIVLDEDSETTVFRIVQESLTNVARHAGATEVTVTLDSTGEACLVTVQDDGVGFNPARVCKTSLGLLGMRERVWMVGGDIEIDSAPGKGTTVVVRVPLDKRSGQSPRAVPY
jgi:signal transduction histidine kinase